MTQWLDFKTIKNRVPMTAVLDRYQIQDLRRSGRDHLRGRCPLHGGEGRETFHVNTAEQVFHCFACCNLPRYSPASLPNSSRKRGRESDRVEGHQPNPLLFNASRFSKAYPCRGCRVAL